MDTGSKPIKYYYKGEDPLVAYVFDFLMNTLGVKGEKEESPEKADILYDDKLTFSLLPTQIYIPAIGFNTRSMGLETLVDSKKNNQFNCDIISSIAVFLTDEVNNSQMAEYDQHDRLMLKSSFQYRNKLHTTPLVNRYVNSFRKMVTQVLKITLIPLYPDNKKACILLTHDVDIPVKHNELFFEENKSSIKNLVKKVRYLFSYLKDRERNAYWTISNLLEEENKYSFKSTFFVATTSKFDQNGHTLDVPYKAHNSMFKRFYELIHNSGSEIGLHASYNSSLSENAFTAEKEKLESTIQSPVLGLRHHFWHLGGDVDSTFKAHSNAGFKYDCSLAFNDGMGFRYNCAIPFYPYDDKRKERIDVLQLPTFCMDGHLYYGRTPEPEDAIQEIKVYIDQIVSSNGVGLVDWHFRTSVPLAKEFKKWGECYLGLLEHLYQRDDIWVTNCKEFYDWWERERFNKD